MSRRLNCSFATKSSAAIRRGARRTGFAAIRQSGDDARPGDGQTFLNAAACYARGDSFLFSRLQLTDFVLNRIFEAYIIDPPHSTASAVSFNSIIWAPDPWKLNNRTGSKIDRVLRLISEWQPEGKIFECYDYAQRVALIW